MSKTSPKQRHTQLLSWLSTFKQSTAKTGKPNGGRSSQQASSSESRMDHYKNKGGR
jgi:hypothetical protein